MSADGPSIGGLRRREPAGEGAGGQRGEPQQGEQDGQDEAAVHETRRAPVTGAVRSVQPAEGGKLRRGPDGCPGADHQTLGGGVGAEALRLGRAAGVVPAQLGPQRPRDALGRLLAGRQQAARGGQRRGACGAAARRRRCAPARGGRRTSPRPAGRACRAGSAGPARRARPPSPAPRGRRSRSGRRAARRRPPPRPRRAAGRARRPASRAGSRRCGRARRGRRARRAGRRSSSPSAARS